MSSSNKRGFGSLGFAGVVGAVLSFCTTPSFTGWAGAAKALLVGAGTSMGATLVAVPAVWIGYRVGALLGAVTGVNKYKSGAAVAILCGFGGLGYGAYHGYDFSASALTEQSCVASFNGTAGKGPLKAAVPAPAPVPTAVSVAPASHSPG